MDGVFAPWHWAILIAVILLIFGPRKLPELGSSLGKGIRGFKNGLTDVQDEFSKAMADAPTEKEPVMAQTMATTAVDAGQTAVVEPAVESVSESAEPVQGQG
jgi:sec-independent protein translocase protein TatA